MPPQTPLASLTDQLLTSLLPANTSAPKLKRLKDGFSKKLRHHNYGRTNQFEVAERFETLQEKLMILNNDELADAFRARLMKLQPLTERWLPDILDLLLRVAIDPANKSKIEWLTQSSSSPSLIPSLVWTDLDSDDPLNRDDQIWQVADYSDFSSENDRSPTRIPKNVSSKSASSGLRKEEDHLRVRSEPVDDDALEAVLDRLGQVQFWRQKPDKFFQLNEEQLVREILFMLQGYPTTLFWRGGERYETDKRLQLQHVSSEGLSSITSTFCEAAILVDTLRDFLKKSQSDLLLQTFRSALEDILRGIDYQFRLLEKRIVQEHQDAISNLISLEDIVNRIVEPARFLAEFIQIAESRVRNDVDLLELLFDSTCKFQVYGDQPAFICLSQLFYQCFEKYWDTIRQWMKTGKLPKVESSIFISPTINSKDLSVLWQKWYQVVDPSASSRCPRFLSPLGSKIFNTGKTRVFVNHLNLPSEVKDHVEGDLTNYISGRTNPLLPFSEVFTGCMQPIVQSSLSFATANLRLQLGENCRLWEQLEALEYIHLGKNGALNDLIDSKIFDAIDKCDRHWNDRFLLQELLQSVFGHVPSIDLNQLSIKASSHPIRNLTKRRQSVRILNELRINYILPWHISNIITKKCLTTYHRISTLLTQIRRAKYMLERRCLDAARARSPEISTQQQNLTISLHHRLLVFINISYEHITTSIIEPANKRLRRALNDAIDIDAMISAHDEYCRHLENACLLSRELKGVRDEFIGILDLCIRFSDLMNQTSIPGDLDSEAGDAQSWRSARSRRRDHREHRDSDPDSEDNEEDEDDGEGYSTFIVPEESSLLEQLWTVEQAFRRKRRFIVGALQGAGRREDGDRSGGLGCSGGHEVCGVGERGFGWGLWGERLEGMRR